MRRVRAREVLAALYEGCDGLVELRSLPSGLQSFFEPADLDGMAALVKGCGEDLYFGVATRRSDASGGLENCAHLPALFVDIEQWMLEKYHYRSPAQVRRDLVGLDAAA